MAEYRLTPRASQDLRDIWHHIAVDNEKAADKLIGRIFDRLELACEHAKMGAARPELSATARNSGRGALHRDLRAHALRRVSRGDSPWNA
ncbi:type II toxin-antitoxin system RelE/ParE family toxin [Mesorhizobium sp. M0204]|uniref:type II toxin-antitoxin system RelE/ParE family toxin n=1 Tax=unclassified Mesorhizobium TaxID=325217 RepID=UPI00333925F6